MVHFSNQKILALLLVATILLVGIFAPLGMAGMGDHHMAGAERCPFMPTQAVLCEMNIMAHIASWQTLFSALSPEFFASLLLTLLLLSFVFLKRVFAPPRSNALERLHLPYWDEISTHPLSLVLLGNSISPRAP